MQPFPETLIEAGLVIGGAIGLLILIAPNFGLKPKATADGWRFPVKPTCQLLYSLALCGGIASVAFSASQLLAKGAANWLGWLGFAFGFLLVPLVLADWPEPLILDRQGLLEGGSASSRICWQELKHVRKYRIRCDRGLVIQGSTGKQLVVADIAYDSKALLDCLQQWQTVRCVGSKDESENLSIFSDRHTQS